MARKKTSKKPKTSPTTDQNPNSAVAPRTDASAGVCIPPSQSLTATRAGPAPAQSNRVPKIVKRWERYFGEDELDNWNRLCLDVGLGGEFSSKTQCRKALKRVNINICDFLTAMERGQPVHHFPSAAALSQYTIKTGKIFPKRHAKEMGPVAALLKLIFR